jgi:hypothetical protein
MSSTGVSALSAAVSSLIGEALAAFLCSADACAHRAPVSNDS